MHNFYGAVCALACTDRCELNVYRRMPGRGGRVSGQTNFFRDALVEMSVFFHA